VHHNPAIYVSLTLLAALGFAAAAVLQQAEAARQNPETSGGGSLLFQLLQKPLWLLGLVAYVIAYGLQVWAVSLGPVVIIQPLIAAQLVFALILGTLFMGRRAGLWEWLGAVGVTIGLGGFIVGTDPSHGNPDATTMAWIISTAGTLVAILLAVGIGSRTRGALQSALYGTAAGLCWGFMIVLMKMVTHGLGEGGFGDVLAMMSRPFVYGLLITAIAGFILLQKAFQAGSLTHALVSYTVLEIVLAVLLGILLFHERPHSDPVSLIITGFSSILILAGIVCLAGARVEKPEPAS
jgi:drug/metabolite transporter (DMT)-like permease